MGVCALVGVLGVLIAALMLFAQAYAPAPEPRTPAERRALNLRVFDKVWETVDRRYYDRTFHGVDWRKMRDVWRPRAAEAGSTRDLDWLVLNQMLGKLQDGHTGVVMPESLSQRFYRANSDHCPPQETMLGVDVANGRVLDVRRGSPADLAGVEPGWTLRSFESNYGAACTTRARVVLLDEHGAQHAFDGTAGPAQPEPRAERARLLVGGAVLLTFHTFDDASTGWLLGQLAHARTPGVILDLRRNLGGRLRDLNVIGAALLGPSANLGAYITQNRVGQQRGAPVAGWARLQPSGKPALKAPYVGPLVVLIGPETGSGAEILADAVQTSRRGVVIGERSAGSVLVSSLFSLPNGEALSVSVADFRGASGRRLEGAGVTPDVPVRQTLAAIRAGRDLPLEAAEARLTTPR